MIANYAINIIIITIAIGGNNYNPLPSPTIVPYQNQTTTKKNFQASLYYMNVYE